MPFLIWRRGIGVWRGLIILKIISEDLPLYLKVLFLPSIL